MGVVGDAVTWPPGHRKGRRMGRRLTKNKTKGTETARTHLSRAGKSAAAVIRDFETNQPKKCTFFFVFCCGVGGAGNVVVCVCCVVLCCVLMFVVCMYCTCSVCVVFVCVCACLCSVCVL